MAHPTRWHSVCLRGKLETNFNSTLKIGAGTQRHMTATQEDRWPTQVANPARHGCSPNFKKICGLPRQRRACRVSRRFVDCRANGCASAEGRSNTHLIKGSRASASRPRVMATCSFQSKNKTSHTRARRAVAGAVEWLTDWLSSSSPVLRARHHWESATQTPSQTGRLT